VQIKPLFHSDDDDAMADSPLGELHMLRARLLVAAFAVVSLALLPGCLTLFSKTEVIRGEEPRRPIRFENAQAAEAFNKAMKDKSASLGGTHMGIPFITFYSKDRQLSDSAHFNDCILRCDTDQDGTITLAEAKMFANLKD
jgi:hypothetical protein